MKAIELAVLKKLLDEGFNYYGSAQLDRVELEVEFILLTKTYYCETFVENYQFNGINCLVNLIEQEVWFYHYPNLRGLTSFNFNFKQLLELKHLPSMYSFYKTPMNNIGDLEQHEEFVNITPQVIAIHKLVGNDIVFCGNESRTHLGNYNKVIKLEEAVKPLDYYVEEMIKLIDNE